MIELQDRETGKFLGQIGDEEMKFLIELLEEEGEADEDYYFDEGTLEFLKENGLSPHLEKILAGALATKGSVEIIFKKK